MRLYGSYNSRFFAVRLPGEIRLYRGITAGAGLAAPNEAGFLWSRQIEDELVGDVIRLGNQGDVFFLGPKGLFRLRNERSTGLDPITPVCTLARGDGEGRLGEVIVDSEGREVCYESITQEARLKDRVLRMLGNRSGGGVDEAHHLLHYDLASQGQSSYVSAVMDPRKAELFRWNISPSCRFMVVANPEKKNLHIQVIDMREEALTAEFEMPFTQLGGLWINDAGSLMLDVRMIGDEKLIIGQQEGRSFTRFTFQPPPGYQVRHLASNYVAITLPTPPRLQLFEFNGAIRADVDVRPLQELRVGFGFNFNERSDIDVMIFRDNQLQIHHSDSRSIVVDAKRWALTARHHQMDLEQKMVRDVTHQHMEAKRMMDHQEMSRQMAAGIGEGGPPSGEFRSPTPSGEFRVPPPSAERPPLPPVVPPAEIPPPAAPVRPVIGRSPVPPQAAEASAKPPGLRRPDGPPVPPAEVPPRSLEMPPHRSVDVMRRAEVPPAPSRELPPPPSREIPPSPSREIPPPPSGEIPAPPSREGAPAGPPAFLKSRGKPLPPPSTEEEDHLKRVSSIEMPAPSLTPPVAPEPPAPLPPAASEAPPAHGASGPNVASQPAPPEPRALANPPQRLSAQRSPVFSSQEGPPPTPAAPSHPAAPAMNLAELEAELERLRMDYIAGEIQREGYYARRAALEEMKKHAQAQPHPPASGEPPKRLALDLGPPPEESRVSSPTDSPHRHQLDSL